jgi:hypothetical protein
MNYNELQDLIKRLRGNNELEFDETIEMMHQAAQELEDILDLLSKQQKIIHRIYADKFPDTYFVCGEHGDKDQNGLPKYIEVCPAYGVDWSHVYERTDRTIGGMGS